MLILSDYSQQSYSLFSAWLFFVICMVAHCFLHGVSQLSAHLLSIVSTSALNCQHVCSQLSARLFSIVKQTRFFKSVSARDRNSTKSFSYLENIRFDLFFNQIYFSLQDKLINLAPTNK